MAILWKNGCFSRKISVTVEALLPAPRSYKTKEKRMVEMDREKISEIYFFHGLGSSKNCFADIEEMLSKNFSVKSMDFCGFGGRLSEKVYGDPIDFCSDEIFEDIKYKENMVFIAHSMGCAIALDLVKKLTFRVKYVIIIEGNLISEDCAYFSRSLASENTVNDVCALRDDVVKKMLESDHVGCREWAMDIKEVSYETLHAYSRSLVQKSDSGELLSTFKNALCKKLYIYGDDYVDHPVLKKLEGIKIKFIRGAGHFVMTDKPKEVFDEISSFLEL